MNPLNVRRYWQTSPHLAVGLLLCFCVPWPTPAVYGQTDRVSHWIKQLKDTNPHSREAAASGLGDTKDPRAVEPLIAALKDNDNLVQWNAATALGKFNDPRAIGPLIDALKNGNHFARRNIARVLGETKDPQAVESLIFALKDTDSEARWSAAKALVSIGTPAVEPLITSLKDTDASVRAIAVVVLLKINDPDAVAPLKTALNDTDINFNFRSGMANALTALCEPGSEDGLIKALNLFNKKGMAEAYLNSGNPKLQSAASAWATSHGYVLRPR